MYIITVKYHSIKCVLKKGPLGVLTNDRPLTPAHFPLPLPWLKPDSVSKHCNSSPCPWKYFTYHWAQCTSALKVRKNNFRHNFFLYFFLVFGMLSRPSQATVKTAFKGLREIINCETVQFSQALWIDFQFAALPCGPGPRGERQRPVLAWEQWKIHGSWCALLKQYFLEQYRPSINQAPAFKNKLLPWCFG